MSGLDSDTQSPEEIGTRGAFWKVVTYSVMTLLFATAFISVIVLIADRSVSLKGPTQETNGLIDRFILSIGQWSSVSDVISSSFGVPVALIGSMVAIYLAQRGFELSRDQHRIVTRQYRSEAQAIVNQSARETSDIFWNISKGLDATLHQADALISRVADVVVPGFTSPDRDEDLNAMRERLKLAVQGAGNKAAMRKEIMKEFIRAAADRDAVKAKSVIRMNEHLADRIARLNELVQEIRRSPMAMSVATSSLNENITIEQWSRIHAIYADAGEMRNKQIRDMPIGELARTKRLANSSPISRIETIGILSSLSAMLSFIEADLRDATSSSKKILHNGYRAMLLTDTTFDMISEHLSGVAELSLSVGNLQHTRILRADFSSRFNRWADADQVERIAAQAGMENILDYTGLPLYQPRLKGRVGKYDWTVVAAGFAISTIVSRDLNMSRPIFDEYWANEGLLCLTLVASLIPGSTKATESFAEEILEAYALPRGMTEYARHSISLFNVDAYVTDRKRQAMTKSDVEKYLLPKEMEGIKPLHDPAA